MKPGRTTPLEARSLGALLAHSEAQPEHVALWIARDAHPQLQGRTIVAEIDRLAEEIASVPLAGLAATAQAQVLIEHLAGKHAFTGNRRAYYDEENHYLDSVLRRKLGVPITLAILYIAVARRLSILATPIGFPGHFLVRIGHDPGVLIDPFDGRILAAADLHSLLARALGPGSVMKPEYLEATSLPLLAQRMLQNLKRIHDGRKDRARALLVLDRLVEVSATPENRRDRGLYALSLGAHQAAATDLAHYLLKRPSAPDADEVRKALERARHSPAMVH